MVCVQEAKRQPLLNSFDLKGVAERVKSGKCMHSILVPNTTVRLTNGKLDKLLCHGASVKPSVMFVGGAAFSLFAACHDAVACSYAVALTRRMHVLSRNLHCLDLHCGSLHDCCVTAKRAQICIHTAYT
jgi:hypothetical protein